MTALGVLGPLPFLLAPYISYAFGVEFGWNEAQRGQVLSAELLGLAVAAFTALFWARRVYWPGVVAAALLLLVAGNLLSMSVDGLGAMTGLRFILGCLAGILMSVYFTFLSFTRVPDRNASILVFSQVSFMILSFVLMPMISERWGVAGLFVFLALTYVAVLIFYWLIPRGAPVTQAETEPQGSSGLTWRIYIPGICVLLASASFFITQVGVWTFFTDIGAHLSLTESQINSILVWSTAAGLIGPAASFFLQDKFGRRIPLAIPAVGQIVLLYLFAQGGFGFVSFLICASLFQVFWNFMLPYAYAVLINVDHTHRLVVLMMTFQAIGIAVGPLLVGSAMVQHGIWAIAGIGTLALVLYMLLIVPFAGNQMPERSAKI